ncbi:MAG: hypothetical protein PHF84_07850, partial [bacterium]|nr:hypothetical protein [bacterium]
MKKKSTLFFCSLIIMFSLSSGWCNYTTEGDDYLDGDGDTQDPANPLLTLVPGSTPDTTTTAFGVPNSVIQNDFNIFFNPSQIMNYGTAYGEVWKAGEVWGGATVRLPLEFKLGIFLGRPYTGKAANYLTTITKINSFTTLGPGFTFSSVPGQLGTINGNLNVPGADLSALTVLNHIDILLGRKITDSLSVGVKFTYADNSDEESGSLTWISNVPNDGSYDTKRSVSDHHLSIGAVIKDLAIFSSLDLSFDMGFMSMEGEYNETQFTNDKNAQVRVESDNSPNISITLRPIMDIGDNRLITVLNYNIIDASSKYTWYKDLDGNGNYTNRPFGEQDASGTYKDTEDLFVGILALHTRPTKQLKLIYS